MSDVDQPACAAARQGSFKSPVREQVLPAVPLEAVLITEELYRRPQRAPDFEAENRALVNLAQVLGDSPRSMLQALTENVLKLLKVGSAGVSLLREDKTSFHRPAVAGLWQPHVGGGTPRDFSPCGEVLDRNAPLLFKHIERHYLYFQAVTPKAHACLLVPIRVDGKAVGTLWAIAHDEHHRFDAEDLRQLTSLSLFAAAACQAVTALDAGVEQAQVARRLTEEAARLAVEVGSLNADLRQGEERFRTVFDSIDEGFCIIEKLQESAGKPLDFRFLETNPAFVAHCGKGGVVGQTIRQAFPEESEEWLHTYDTVLSTGEPTRFERRLAQGRLLQVHAFKIEGTTHSRLAVIFQDITQRKLAEDGLRENEAFNRSIIASSPDCIKVLDLEGNLLSMHTGQELLGIEDIRPFLNKSWLQFWGADVQKLARAALASAAAGQTGKFVGFFRTLRGEPKWWDVAISPILDEQRQPVRFLAVSRDVTHRKQVEDSLLQRTLQFETLVNNAPLGIYLVDGDFRIRHVNPIALPEFGGTADLIGRDFGDAVHTVWDSARADEVVRRFRHTLATGEAYEAYEAPKPMDRRIDRETSAHCEWRINRIPLPDGSHGVVCYFLDMTDRKQAEKALRTSDERYRSLFNATDEGYCIIEMNFDADDRPVDWCFLEVNPAFAALTGLVDAVGKQMRDLAPDHEAHWFETYGRVALTGESVRFVNESRTLEGRWFDVYACRVGGAESRQVAVVYNDISERKTSEIALRQSEERFRALFERGPIAMVSCDRQGVIQEFNLRAMELWGRQPHPGDAESAFRSAFRLGLPDGSPIRNSQSLMQQVLSGELPAAVDRQMEFERADGSRVPVVVNIVPLRDGEGGIAGAINCFYDITERRRAEEALRASEEQFRATFENAAIGIVHVGLDNRWLRVNPAMCRLTGYAAEELTAMAFTELTHPEDVGNNLDQLQRLLAGEIASYTIDKRFIHKSGRHVWVTATAALLRNAAGQPQYFIGALEDISEKRQTLAELDLQRRFVERLTHGMPNTLHVYSRAERRNVWVNRHLGDSLGYSAQDITLMGPRFLPQVLHPDDAAAMDLHFDRVFAAADNDVLDFEYRVRDHDGHWRWLRQSDTVFHRDLFGRVAEVVGTATDVTRRKGIEAELLAALAAAEQANQAKSAFVSSMSHELRSPLNAMLGFAQLLQTGSPSPTALQEESVGEILKAGWYLLGLIDEILDLAQIESGRLSCLMEWLPLAEVLDDCHAMVEGHAAQRGVTLDFVTVDQATSVSADRTRVRQVLINLLSNAIKYNRPDGTVNVTLSSVAQGRVRISVEDSGIGLSTAQQAKLFQPFERLGQQAGSVEGTGIGLALSKHLVELMGGRIGVHSTPGQGSVFWVELDGGATPLALPEQAPHFQLQQPPHSLLPSEAPPATAPERQHTVLCVEDNAANLLLVQQLLARHRGVHLLLARDGHQGLQMARALRPDVVLIDINLPGISGLEVLSQLSADGATAHIPVIAMSAHAMHCDVKMGLQAGFFRYLIKPFRIDTFREALNSALAQAPAGAPLNNSLHRAPTP